MKFSEGSSCVCWVAAAFLATVGIYIGCAYIGTGVCGNDDPKEVVYNRMIEGFGQGHLNLARQVPMGFALLQDPFDPEQNAPYRAPPYFLYDLSYYRGKLYAYFGPVPALILFGPFHLITGKYLSYKAAAVVYCAGGLASMAWLLLGARRRYAPETPGWVMAMLVCTFGLSTGLPTLLARVDIWEIPIAGATATILFVVAALWQAWHQPARRAVWLAAASVGIGLAVGTRPTAVLVAPILILPLSQEWREYRGARVARIIAGTALPFVLCMGALALFNVARFGNPMEFGQTYQLAALQYVGKLRQYGFDYIWDNIRIYFLNFAPWTTTFPYFGSPPSLVLSASHAKPEFCFGILGNVPIVFMALTALLVWRRRDGLSFIASVLLWVAAVQIGLLMVFFGAVSRYEVEILTPLLGLAAIGLLAVEARQKSRSIVRGVWVALAAASVAFNLAQAVIHADWTRKKASYWFVSLNQTESALEDYNVLVLLEPPSAELHNARGIALGTLSRWREAIPDFETAVRLAPANADAACNLGTAFINDKNPAAAIAPLQESLRLRPGDPRASEQLETARRMLGEQPAAAPR
jgi:tetratricopeptide (TPR) repeat protein